MHVRQILRERLLHVWLLDKLRIVMDLEKTFGVSIPDEQIHRINTVSDAAAIVRERLSIL